MGAIEYSNSRGKVLDGSRGLPQLNEGNQGSLHDEIYLSMGFLKGLLRAFGQFPIDETTGKDSMQSVVDGLRFRWTSKWLLISVISMGGVTSALLSVLLDYTFLIPNKLESIVITTYVIIICLASYSNVIFCVLQAKYWPSYFKQWQEIDELMGITIDRKLRLYVRRVGFIVAFLSVLVASGGVMTIAFKYKYKEDDFTKDTFPLGAICFSAYLNGCQIVPEVFFTYISQALSYRFQALSKEIQKLFQHAATSPEASDIAVDISKIRIIHQHLINAIHRTNFILGPVFLVTCTMCVITLSGGVYFLLRQSVNNLGIIIVKVALIVGAILRITSICLFSHQIGSDVKDITRNLCQAPFLSMTKASVEEVKIFLKCIKASSPQFHAMGFTIMDKDLLNSVASISVTYTFTMLQFDQDSDKLTSECGVEVATLKNIWG